MIKCDLLHLWTVTCFSLSLSISNFTPSGLYVFDRHEKSFAYYTHKTSIHDDLYLYFFFKDGINLYKFVLFDSGLAHFLLKLIY